MEKQYNKKEKSVNQDSALGKFMQLLIPSSPLGPNWSTCVRVYRQSRYREEIMRSCTHTVHKSKLSVETERK